MVKIFIGKHRNENSTKKNKKNHSRKLAYTIKHMPILAYKGIESIDRSINRLATITTVINIVSQQILRETKQTLI